MATLPQTGSFPAASAPLQSEAVQDLIRLQKAAQRISSILDLDQLIGQVANEVAESLGCVETAIYLHDEDRAELVLTGVHGCTVHGKGHRLKLGLQGLVGHVAGTRQMRYAPDVTRDPYYIACEPATRSEVAIPLFVEQRLVGVLAASHHELDAFPPERLRFLQALSGHVAVAVRNAKQFQCERQQRELLDREAEEARQIQRALLPKSSPYIPGFAVTGLSVPAGAVGGDWFDFIPLGDGRWAVVLADVSGKGMAAALLMSATRGMLRSLAEACCTPAEVLARLNCLLVDDLPTGKFVTLVYAVFDPQKSTVTFANAGHLPPVLLADDGPKFLETQEGLPLGLGRGAYSEVTVTLPKGAHFVLYSDGITEATNRDGEEYGLPRLQDQLGGVDCSPEVLLDSVRAFASGVGLQDDASVVMIRAHSSD